MPEDPETINQHLCPACFAKEMDKSILLWDQDDKEYYCVNCAYTGDDQKVKEFFKSYLFHKYEVNYKFRSDTK